MLSVLAHLALIVCVPAFFYVVARYLIFRNAWRGTHIAMTWVGTVGLMATAIVGWLE